MTIIDAIYSREIFAPPFKDPRTWHAWEVYLRGLFGLGLERRARSGGKDLVTHYPGGHDDVANAAAGALVAAFHSISRPGVQIYSLRDPGERPRPAFDISGRLIRIG